jgi:predicted nucleic acid-binding protein
LASNIDSALEAYAGILTRVVPIGQDVAGLAFDLGRQTPDRLPLIDALIVATAVREQACLVHRDRHMSAIPTSVVEQIDLASAPTA